MFVKSFGCSFIFGNDLPDDGRDSAYATASQLTWPALVAKKLELPYKCAAVGGSGNLYILDNILNSLAANIQPHFCIIGWTWIDRFDYTESTAAPRGWKTLTPINNSALAKTYYRDLHSEYRDKFVNLVYIYTAIQALKARNIPFVMTVLDDLVLDEKYHFTPAMADLQQKIRPHITDFEGMNFLEWSRKKGFPISGTLHPLEQAHAAAAELLWPKLKAWCKQNTVVHWHPV